MNDAEPQRYCVETAWSDDIGAVMTSAADAIAVSPSDETLIHLSFRTNPTIAPDAACGITGTVLLFSSAVWRNASDDEANLAWSDALIDALAPATIGRYIGECDYLRHPERGAECHTPATRGRLTAAAARYDPLGTFIRLE